MQSVILWKSVYPGEGCRQHNNKTDIELYTKYTGTPTQSFLDGKSVSQMYPYALSFATQTAIQVSITKPGWPRLISPTCRLAVMSLPTSSASIQW